MMIKPKHLFVTLLVLGFFSLFLLLAFADTMNLPQSFVFDSITETDIVGEKPKITGSGDFTTPTITDIQKPTKIYIHPELGYSFKYPSDWLLGTYPSNGYEAVGLWDSVAQQQGDEYGGHLMQGVKIEITACDCAPSESLKDRIIENDRFSPETITEIYESFVNFYQDEITIPVLKGSFNTELGGGKILHFIGRDGRWYVFSLMISDYSKSTVSQVQEYESIFEEIVRSFAFSKIVYENR